MAERELDMGAGALSRRLSRRAIVRMGLAMAALPVLAACGSQQAAPAKPKRTTKKAATAEAAEPAEEGPAVTAAETPAEAAPAKPKRTTKKTATAEATEEVPS